MSEPTITVAVDVTNPGQFFACCGLLELADRLWPGAEGWFADGQVHIACDGLLDDVLQALIAREPEQMLTLDNGLTVKPLIAPLRLSLGDGPGQTLLLDAWSVVKIDKGVPVVAANSPWNFWSGQQTSHRIWCGLRDVLADQLRTMPADRLPDLFAQRVFQKGRFGFDPGPAWTALDVGFSPNEHGMRVKSSAAVELLAAVGLQRFRPEMIDRDSFRYATWGGPLAPAVAAVAATGRMITQPARRFCGRVVARGSYAALGYSTPLLGDAHA